MSKTGRFQCSAYGLVVLLLERLACLDVVGAMVS